MFICTLPVDSEWVELMKASKSSGGLYLDANVFNKPHLGDAKTCWEEFETDDKRSMHQDERHPEYIQLHREQIWQAFERKHLLNPVTLVHDIVLDSF